MKISKTILISIALSSFLYSSNIDKSATRVNINILEKTEDIRSLSQNIANEYLFFYKRNKKDSSEYIEMIKKLNQLNEDIIIIAKNTNNKDTKNIVDFLAYTKNEIELLLKEELKEQNIALILDYSEIILEGADSISNNHKYSFSNEENMIMNIKEMDYLLERILKFYLALNLGLNNSNNQEQLRLSITEFDKNINNIKNYEYKDTYSLEKKKFLLSWKNNRDLFLKYNEYSIPALLNLSVKNLKQSLDILETYHNKKQ